MSQFEKYIFPANNGKNKNAYVNTQNNQDTNIGEYLALGAGGNIFGTALGLGANYLQQQQQLSNQKELMQEQNKINMQNASIMPSVQKNAMENAGMNPAMGAGQFASAPSVSQGAASMGSMQLANVFDGIANIIAAAKAPSEIAQTEAQTGLTTAQTGKTTAETGKITFDINKINAEISKLAEETQNAKNINEIYDSANKFAKEQSSAIFSDYKAKLEATGAWDKLPEKTKLTIEDLIAGNITLDKGSTEQFFKSLELQKYLAESDAAIVKSYVDLAVSANQLNNKEILDAIANLPKDTHDKIQNDIKKILAEIPKIKSETDKNNVLTKIAKLNDYALMVNEGNTEGVKTKATIDGIQKVGELLSDIIKLRFGRGKPKGKSKTSTTPNYKNFE